MSECVSSIFEKNLIIWTLTGCSIYFWPYNENALKPLVEASFYSDWEIFKTCFLHLLMTKIVDHASFSRCAGIKRAQFDICGGQKGAGLRRCVRVRIVMVNNDSSSLVSFSNFLEDFRQTNCGISLRCSSGTVATWPYLSKKQATICFEVLLPWTTFVGFGSSSQTYTVECCLVSDSYAHMHDSSPVTIHAGGGNAQGCLSHGMSHDDLALWVHARHQCSLTQRLDDLHGPRFWASVDHHWIH